MVVDLSKETKCIKIKDKEFKKKPDLRDGLFIDMQRLQKLNCTYTSLRTLVHSVQPSLSY